MESLGSRTRRWGWDAGQEELDNYSNLEARQRHGQSSACRSSRRESKYSPSPRVAPASSSASKDSKASSTGTSNFIVWMRCRIPSLVSGKISTSGSSRSSIVGAGAAKLDSRPRDVKVTAEPRRSSSSSKSKLSQLGAQDHYVATMDVSREAWRSLLMNKLKAHV